MEKKKKKKAFRKTVAWQDKHQKYLYSSASEGGFIEGISR